MTTTSASVSTTSARGAARGGVWAAATPARAVQPAAASNRLRDVRVVMTERMANLGRAKNVFVL